MQYIKRYVIAHHNSIIYLLILFCGGILCGTLLINYFSSDEIVNLNSYLVSIPNDIENMRNYFTQQVFINSLIITLLMICGYSLFAIPLISFIIFTKGLQIGFSCCVYLSVYDVRGIIAIIILLIPQVVFELLAYLVIGICSVETSIVVLKSVNSSSMISLTSLMRSSLNYLLFTFILIVISFFIKCNYYYITSLVLDLLA